MNRAGSRRNQHASPAHGTFTFQQLLDAGKGHQQAGRLAEAEQAYRLALEMVPDQPEALHLMGLVAYRTGRLDAGIEFLRQATERSPGSPVYWFNLGVVTQRAGRL